MKCEKCGKVVDKLEIDLFQYDGSDCFERHPFCETEEGIVISTNPNWTGYELSKEEMVETIRCPHCKQFPLDNENFDVSDDEVFITLSKNKTNTMSRINRIKQMNTKEFAEFLRQFTINTICGKAPLIVENWLNEEIEGETII